ncbi:hypothetical protein PACILC2_34890 [Paenibacillus cisolokensis]|uniref:Uncharacterized protein n=1 Tax=Paenibacillus cisolokensis TaxID=1658519 RepID=A0ABQ4NAH9_9BACL|nr:hypothetical protein PACILC2_34890 [Paenibacillus cisolokensis]
MNKKRATATPPFCRIVSKSGGADPLYPHQAIKYIQVLSIIEYPFAGVNGFVELGGKQA